VGIRAWFISSLIPVEVLLVSVYGLLALSFSCQVGDVPMWLTGGLAIAVQVVLTVFYIDRRYPLALGPTHG